jgi:hypothetical protein
MKHREREKVSTHAAICDSSLRQLPFPSTIRRRDVFIGISLCKNSRKSPKHLKRLISATKLLSFLFAVLIFVHFDMNLAITFWLRIELESSRNRNFDLLSFPETQQR